MLSAHFLFLLLPIVTLNGIVTSLGLLRNINRISVKIGYTINDEFSVEKLANDLKNNHGNCEEDRVQKEIKSITLNFHSVAAVAIMQTMTLGTPVRQAVAMMEGSVIPRDSNMFMQNCLDEKGKEIVKASVKKVSETIRKILYDNNEKGK